LMLFAGISHRIASHLTRCLLSAPAQPLPEPLPGLTNLHLTSIYKV
jgi:hypothetical protein